MHFKLFPFVALVIAIQSTPSAPADGDLPKTGVGASKAEAVITVIDEAGKRHTLTAAAVSQMPQQRIKTKDHETDAEFEGVNLVDLLKSQGISFGKDLRGARAGLVVVCDAADGYRVPLALLEIDPETNDKLVLVADRRDGKPLDEKQGPLRLIIPNEKRPIRWIRMLNTIRVVNMKDIAPPSSPNSATGQPSK